MVRRQRSAGVIGYFGSVPGGLLDQIGRGYTDLCAALVAIGVEAEELQVWKEVDGIFSADPSKVPTARLLSTITPTEAAELTFYGSEVSGFALDPLFSSWVIVGSSPTVPLPRHGLIWMLTAHPHHQVIHPFTMEQVIRARIPIRIKNVMNPRGDGTVIMPEAAVEPRSVKASRPKRPTAVTIKRNIVVINVRSNKRSLSHGFFAKIFSVLDHWRLSVDLISTSEVHVSMALHSGSKTFYGGGADEDRLVDQELQAAIGELRDYGTVDILPGMAILSLVGNQMKHMIGIAGRMFSTLGEHDVNIEMISQGELGSGRSDGVSR